MIGFERGTRIMGYVDQAAARRTQFKTNTELARELAVMARSQHLMTAENEREMSTMFAEAVALLADELDLLRARLEHMGQHGYVATVTPLVTGPITRLAPGIVEVPHASAGCDHEFVNGRCFFCSARPR